MWAIQLIFTTCIAAWAGWAAWRTRARTMLAVAIFAGAVFLETAWWAIVIYGDRSLALARPLFLMVMVYGASAALAVAAVSAAWMLRRPSRVFGRKEMAVALAAWLVLVSFNWAPFGSVLSRLGDGASGLYSPVAAFLLLLVLRHVRDDECAWALSTAALGLMVYTLDGAVGAYLFSQSFSAPLGWDLAVLGVYCAFLAASLVLMMLAPPARRTQYAFFISGSVAMAAISAYVYAPRSLMNPYPEGALYLEVGSTLFGVLLFVAGSYVAMLRLGANEDEGDEAQAPAAADPHAASEEFAVPAEGARPRDPTR